MKISCSLFLLLGCLISCTNEAGVVFTRDGRLVSETPEVAADEFAWQLGQRASHVAGTDWKCKAVIRDLPILHLLNADEYGWKEMTVDLEIVPPRGDGGDRAQARRQAESAVQELARRRLARGGKLEIVTVMREPGAPPPGSQSYTSVSGDTWAGISTAFYGSTAHWRLIADANPGVDGNPIPVGTVLVIPPRP